MLVPSWLYLAAQCKSLSQTIEGFTENAIDGFTASVVLALVRQLFSSINSLNTATME